jgi:hypothetical protein
VARLLTLQSTVCMTDAACIPRPGSNPANESITCNKSPVAFGVRHMGVCEVNDSTLRTFYPNTSRITMHSDRKSRTMLATST